MLSVAIDQAARRRRELHLPSTLDAYLHRQRSLWIHLHRWLRPLHAAEHKLLNDYIDYEYGFNYQHAASNKHYIFDRVAASDERNHLYLS